MSQTFERKRHRKRITSWSSLRTSEKQSHVLTNLIHILCTKLASQRLSFGLKMNASNSELRAERHVHEGAYM